MLNNASTYLYEATDHRAFFKDVTILIPDTWEDKPIYQSPQNATFEGADIIVAPRNPRFAPSPGFPQHRTPNITKDVASRPPTYISRRISCSVKKLRNCMEIKVRGNLYSLYYHKFVCERPRLERATQCTCVGNWSLAIYELVPSFPNLKGS